MNISKLYLIGESNTGEKYKIMAFTAELFPILDNVLIDNEVKLYPQKLDVKIDKYIPDSKVRRVKETEQSGVLEFYCEGCEENTLKKTNRVIPVHPSLFTFNNNIYYPSFYPSLIWKNKKGKTCHSIIEDGFIKFHKTSQHKFAGKLMELKEIK